MSIYDNRNTAAYQNYRIEPSYSKNQHILNWWNSNHDGLLVAQIDCWQWVWYWTINDEIIKNTSPEIIGTWKEVDPLCKKYAWQSILMNFSAARAEQLGFTKSIRLPQQKICPLCENSFIEDSLPMPLTCATKR